MSGHRSARIEWQRFWYPRGDLPLLDRDVFLWDPSDPIAQRINPDAGPLEQYDTMPVLVLLGEPGIGKSDAVGARAADASWPVKVMNLPDVVDLDLLKQDIGRAVQLHDEGAEIVELIFDGLDEALVRESKTAKWLSSALEVVPDNRRAHVRVRITCRPAVWPETLGYALAGFWNIDAPKVLVMAPLRIQDVNTAASLRDVDSSEFVNQLIARGLLSFAARPVTLLPLLDMFREGRLPETNVDLFRSLTRRLAEYDSRGHYDARLSSPFPGPAKAEVAGRLAALSLLSGRPLLTRLGPGTTLRPADLDVDEARGGTLATAIDAAAVIRALDSGLFNTAGTDRFRFAHRSYGEFLAADTLDRSGQPTTALLSLVRGPDQPSILPQLAEVAAWLAVLRRDVFDELVNSEPELLLSSDVATRSDADRERLALAILARQDTVPAPHLPLEHLHKLRSPAARTIVAEYLSGGHTARATEAALSIAGASGDPALVSDVVAVVADSRLASEVREYAAFALPHRLSDHDAATLKAVLAPGSGTSDELRGRILIKLWPHHLTIGEVLALAVPPSQPQLRTAYRQFLGVTLPSAVSADDMPALLLWALAAARSGNQTLADAADTALQAAAPHLADPAIAQAAAPVVLARQGESGVSRRAAETALRMALVTVDARRALGEAVVSAARDDATVAQFARSFGSSDDFGWALTRTVDAGRPAVERRRWAVSARWLFDPDNHPQHLDQLWVIPHNPQVIDEFRFELEGHPISGPEADAARARFNQIRQWEVERQGWGRERALRLGLVDEVLASGRDDSWSAFSKELDRPDGGTARVRVTEFASWGELGEDRRALAAAAAGRWVLTQDPPEPDRPNFWRLEVFDALRALWLAVEVDPSLMEVIDADRCGRWARLLIGAASVGASDADRARRDELLAVCYRRASVATRSAMLAELDAHALEARDSLASDESSLRTRSDEGGDPPSSRPRTAPPVHAHEALAAVWDDALSDALLAWQTDQPDEVGLAETVPFLAFRGRPSDAERLAVRMLEDSARGPSGARRRAAAAAALLYCPSGATHWARILAAVQADEETGLGLLERLHSSGLGLFPSLAELGPNELADLYLWLRPRAPAPASNDGFTHPLTASGDAVLRHLQSLGTDNAVQALQRIAEAIPADESLPYVVAEGRRRRLEASWNPPSPAEIRVLLDDPTRILASGDRDLGAAIVTSIRRAQNKVTGQTPAVADLWDFPHDTTKRTPKPEAQLSDWIKRHLEADLPALLVNREVEISPGWKDAEPGERVDLHVTTSLPGDAGRPLRATVIIESKGCWNAQLDENIDDQLALRYMRRLGSHHGVYLVFWFDCQNSGSRRDCASCRHRTLDQLRQDLDKHAADLVPRGDYVTVSVLRAGLSGSRSEIPMAAG